MHYSTVWELDTWQYERNERWCRNDKINYLVPYPRFA